MILHITNDYAGSSVYKNLISNLDQSGVKQIIYTPIKSSKSIGKNSIELKEKESKIIYSNVLNMHIDRVLFNIKINKIDKDIKTKVEINKVSCIHAHTWFSDGAVALKLNKEFNIPYIIAVRGSDLNQFWKLPHLKKQGLEILSKATKIIFITPRYRERFLEINKVKQQGACLAEKTMVILNGLDNYWLKNVKPRRMIINLPVNLLYIGVFSKTKNVLRLIKSIEKVNDLGIKCTLTLVGGGGHQEKKILSQVSNKTNITFLGKIYSKTALSKLFKQTDIFVMPSIQETFGLVYAEALSQGIPVLYTRNEGIDGVFKENIGVAVNPKSVESIADGLLKIIENYNKFNFNPQQVVGQLDWSKIAKKYTDIYQNILEK